MKIYLVRHGQVNHNLKKIYSNEDENLNETGIKEAYELRKKLENTSYDVIISSPLKRTLHTANVINSANKEIIIKEFFNKVTDFLDELKTKDYKSVIIVAHSGVSKAFYGYFNGIPKDGKFLNLGLNNCKVKEYIL